MHTDWIIINKIRFVLFCYLLKGSSWRHNDLQRTYEIYGDDKFANMKKKEQNAYTHHITSPLIYNQSELLIRIKMKISKFMILDCMHWKHVHIDLQISMKAKSLAFRSTTIIIEGTLKKVSNRSNNV